MAAANSDMRLVIAGAGGRMGRTLIHAIAATKGVTLVGAAEAADSAVIGRDAGELAGLGRNGIKVSQAGAERALRPRRGRPLCCFCAFVRTWMLHCLDGRVKPGHDGVNWRNSSGFGAWPFCFSVMAGLDPAIQAPKSLANRPLSFVAVPPDLRRKESERGRRHPFNAARLAQSPRPDRREPQPDLIR